MKRSRRIRRRKAMRKRESRTSKEEMWHQREAQRCVSDVCVCVCVCERRRVKRSAGSVLAA